ncbi:protein kinase domain-containing protein [Actinomadura monticuli]|uniref:non-specific serine/threonine protein kinase n=1 Tax=Actinomadura monticuli TaxID=3097367 RepID=A0ABV4Q538_9ACTN
MLSLPLKRSFRYVHEPLRAGVDAIPSLGNEQLATELRDRIAYSRGGAFLISGFRGAGKSTTVLRALDALVQDGDRGELVVPVVLNIARSTDTDRLLFALVRRIFESLNDEGLLARLPAETQQSLLLAYMRTSLSFKQTVSDALERGAIADAGGGSALKTVVPKLSLTAKRTRSLAHEAQFLAYSETDVEHDLMRIVTLIDREGVVVSEARGRLRRLWPWPRTAGSRLRLAVVLDEADKLTDGESSLSAVEKLLGGIKNVLTMPGIHFLVVAGPDLHDQVIRDAARGNSVYESVFGWRMYVPCIWDAVHHFVEGLLMEPPGDQVDELTLFCDYLSFKARGMPRRLLQEFHQFVVWENGSPLLRVTDRDAERIRFYARLEDILRKHLDNASGAELFPVPIDEDRRRLSAYYVIDWVLRSEGEPFRTADLFTEDGNANELDPLLRASPRSVEHLLRHLADHGVLETVRRAGDGDATLIGDVPSAQENVYQLASGVKRALLGFARGNQSERVALGMTPANPPTEHTYVMLMGRYRLEQVIGEGGMSRVWRGHDKVLGRAIAVKMLRELPGDQSLTARFKREIRIFAGLDHPNIVQYYDAIERDETLAIVMEFVQGPTLAELVRREPLHAKDVARIGAKLAHALVYLEEQGVFRLDMKPANVMMPERDEPKIIDLGIARHSESADITGVGSMIGTPHYMAPEQVDGMPPDHRGDIFAFGATMVFALTGAPPVEADNALDVIRKLLTEDIDVSGLPCSAEFRQVLHTALRRDPAERFQHAADLVTALEAVPELAPAGPHRPGE